MQTTTKLWHNYMSEGYILNRISERVAVQSRNVRLCSRCLFPELKQRHSETSTETP